VMVADLDAAESLIELDQDSRALLASAIKPIVLADIKPNSGLAPDIAPGLNRLGVMLAYTPLHHLLLKYGPKALVMTSGNLSGGPICRSNQEALHKLGSVADAFLMHDRDIIARADDSVVWVAAGKVQVLRRARGYAPRPLHLFKDGPPVLALGAELKNTVCLVKGDKAFISPHIGDLKDADTLDCHRETTRHLLNLLNLNPQVLAVDLHPDYLSGKEADQYPGLPLVRVQHHVAHALGAMAEAGLDMPCMALCLDGSGYGLDGSIWGGEILYVGPQGFRRVGGLRPAPLPGGIRPRGSPGAPPLAGFIPSWGVSGLNFRPQLLGPLSGRIRPRAGPMRSAG
jgi:hydrogenase maturation protein HypF